MIKLKKIVEDVRTDVFNGRVQLDNVPSLSDLQLRDVQVYCYHPLAISMRFCYKFEPGVTDTHCEFLRSGICARNDALSLVIDEMIRMKMEEI